MEVFSRIKALRIKKGLTQKELSEKLNVSTVSIGNWEAGIKRPSIDVIILMAKIFDVTTDYLLGISVNRQENDVLFLDRREHKLVSNYRILDNYGKKAVDALCLVEKMRVESEKTKCTTVSNMVSIANESKLRYIPRYMTPSAAGYSVPIEGDDYEMIAVEANVPDDADFAVRIQGDSMLPYISDGDTVYVKRDCELSIGDIGIFSVDGAMYCKQYYVDGNANLTLVSANPELKSTNIFVGAESSSFVKCYGKVLTNFRTVLPEYLSE